MGFVSVVSLRTTNQSPSPWGGGARGEGGSITQKCFENFVSLFLLSKILRFVANTLSPAVAKIASPPGRGEFSQ